LKAVLTQSSDSPTSDCLVDNPSQDFSQPETIVNILLSIWWKKAHIQEFVKSLVEVEHDADRKWKLRLSLTSNLCNLRRDETANWKRIN
jgi:hypothetical protein